jgi:hypothetical protein
VPMSLHTRLKIEWCAPDYAGSRSYWPEKALTMSHNDASDVYSIRKSNKITIGLTNGRTYALDPWRVGLR